MPRRGDFLMCGAAYMLQILWVITYVLAQQSLGLLSSCKPLYPHRCSNPNKLTGSQTTLWGYPYCCQFCLKGIQLSCLPRKSVTQHQVLLGSEGVVVRHHCILCRMHSAAGHILLSPWDARTFSSHVYLTLPQGSIPPPHNFLHQLLVLLLQHKPWEENLKVQKADNCPTVWGKSIMAGRTWQQQHEAPIALHPQSGGRKRWMSLLSSLSISFSLGYKFIEWHYIYPAWILSSHLPLFIIPHRIV